MLLHASVNLDMSGTIHTLGQGLLAPLNFRDFFKSAKISYMVLIIVYLFIVYL